MRYVVGPTSRLVVKARSSIHDTVTTWDKVTGTATADPDTLATVGATATFDVDMTSFDAGDWLKNRKLRKDFDLDAHPRATFELTAVQNVVRTGVEFTATAVGLLRWRGRQVPLTLTGKGTLDAARLEATASFALDIRQVGLAAPRVLMFKVDDEVTIDVTLRGTAAP
jgi:polyisoprenoid-binding protein YceI